MMIIYKILFSILGGWLSRIMGGGRPDIYIPAQWPYALPYAFILGHSWLGLVCYLSAAIGARIIHYPYFLMGNFPPVDLTRVPPTDFIIKPFFGPMLAAGGQYWRCVAGLAVTGICVTLVSGVLYAVMVDPVRGVLIALSGGLKPLGYIFGTFIQKYTTKLQENVYGEFGRGLTGWGALSCIL